MISMFIRDNENAFDSRSIVDTFCRVCSTENWARRNCAGSDNKEEKSGNVSRRNDGTEVQKTSSKSRRQRREIKRTDVSLSPVIPSASNVFRSHVLSSLFPVSSPLTAEDALRPG